MKRFFLIIAKLGICFLLYVVNFHYCVEYIKMRSKVKVEDVSSVYYFQVVVLTPEGAELFLIREEWEEFIKTHDNYSYLIPAGQELLVQEQILASYKKKYHGKSYPTIKWEQIDAGHQYVELYMNGEHRDEVLWYEAADKNFVPKYGMMYSAFDLFAPTFLCIALVLIEYKQTHPL